MNNYISRFSCLMLLALLVSFCKPCNAQWRKKKDKKQNTSLTQEDTLSPYQYWEAKKCKRPYAIPSHTLNSQNLTIVKSSYVLYKDKGVERAMNYLGDSIIIEDGGCDCMELIYTVKFKRTLPQDTGKAAWFNKAGEFLLSYRDSNVPFDYVSACNALQSLGVLKNTRFGVDYQLSREDNISETISVLNAGRTSGGGGFLRLKLYYKALF